MTASMGIVLVRHGETALNVARVLQPADTPLSASGVAQAQAVARRLATLGVAGIVSSDLPRAWVTAQAIARACGLPVTASALLHERNFGDLRGQPYDRLGFDPLAMNEAPPGGESVPVFSARVAAAFDQMLRLRAALPGPLVVVTHGMVIRALLTHHGRLADGIRLPQHLGNTCVSVVSVQPPHDVGLLACTRHLDASTQPDARSLSGG